MLNKIRIFGLSALFLSAYAESAFVFFNDLSGAGIRAFFCMRAYVKIKERMTDCEKSWNYNGQ